MLDDESEEANVLTLRGYAALDEIEPFLDHPLNLNYCCPVKVFLST